MKQHYMTLNLQDGASLAEVKKASRKLLLKYHPDLHPNNQIWAQEKTRIILTAYNVLCDNLVSMESFTSGQTYQPFAATPPRIETVPLMVFSISNLTFSVKVEQVKMITMLQSVKVIKITNRRGLYPFISGIIHYQGTVAPLLDLGNKLNVESISQRQQLLICEVENQPMALLIDEGKNVINIEHNHFFNHAHFHESEIPVQYIKNVLYHQSEKIHVLDLGKLLTH